MTSPEDLTNKTTLASRLAAAISIAGHPLLVMALASVLIAFHLYEPPKASLIAAVIVTLVIIPVVIHNTLKTRQKVYTNFDVSDQTQRISFYRFGLIVLAIGTAVLYFIPGAHEFFAGTLTAFALLVTSALINFKIKSSLHTSVIIFVSIVCLEISTEIGVSLLVFAIAVAASRLVLKRHTFMEVITGAIIGASFGLIHFYLV